MNPYEVIEAKTAEEALALSKWKAGDLAMCKEVRVVANLDGTWSVFPTFEKQRPLQVATATELRLNKGICGRPTP